MNHPVTDEEQKKLDHQLAQEWPEGHVGTLDVVMRYEGGQWKAYNKESYEEFVKRMLEEIRQLKIAATGAVLDTVEAMQGDNDVETT